MEWKPIAEVDDLTADQCELVKDHLAHAFEVAASMARKSTHLDEGAARTAAFNALTQAVRGYQVSTGGQTDRAWGGQTDPVIMTIKVAVPSTNRGAQSGRPK